MYFYLHLFICFVKPFLHTLDEKSSLMDVKMTSRQLIEGKCAKAQMGTELLRRAEKGAERPQKRVGVLGPAVAFISQISLPQNRVALERYFQSSSTSILSTKTVQTLRLRKKGGLL